MDSQPDCIVILDSQEESILAESHSARSSKNVNEELQLFNCYQSSGFIYHVIYRLIWQLVLSSSLLSSFLDKPLHDPCEVSYF